MNTFVPVIIPLFLEEDHDPIDWECKNCGHSWKKHRFGKCTKGLFSKCDCDNFEINNEQVEKVQKKLKDIEAKLFEDYSSANKLQGEIT